MRLATIALLATLIGLTAGCGKTQSTPSGSGDPAPAPAPQPMPKGNPTPGSGGGIPSTPDDAKAIEGKWQLVSYQNPDPKRFPPAELDAMKAASFKVVGQLLTVDGEKDLKGNFLIRLNPGKSPKEFDLIRADSSGKPQMTFSPAPKGTTPPPPKEHILARGIYRLDGDTATVALGFDEEVRPKEFKAEVIDAKTENYVFVFEFKRVK